MFARLRPHTHGFVYVALILLVGLAAVNNQNNLLFWVFGVMVSGLVLSLFVAWLSIRSISVRRIDPQHGAVGEPMLIRYALRNRSRLASAFSLHVDELPPATESRRSADVPRDWRRIMEPARAWVMQVGPREIVHGEAVFWPTARGEVRFDRLRITTTFPFGLVRWSRVISQPQHTLIYPMLYELRHGILNTLTPPGLLGSRVSQHAGAGEDFFGLREFRPGDSLRHIAWKRTASSDKLVSVERTSPSPARLRVILDLTIATNLLKTAPAEQTSARELEERAISLTASLIHAAEAQGFEVGLTIMGFDVPPIAVRRSPWHVGKIMAALAGLDPDLPRLAARPHMLREAERAGLVIVSPDRVTHVAELADAWHLTARQLEALAVKPIGWDPNARLSPRAGSSTSAMPRLAEVAA
jgi:uncharacterized protein (DUF58 family)